MSTTQHHRAVSRPLVVVPTYQEVASIRSALDAVLSAAPDVDVLVVDDASPDGTGDLVEELGRTQPRVHLLRRPGKAGLGTAYRAGFAWGLARGYDALVEMDADLSHPADRLEALLAGLADADLVIGSRYVAGGSTRNWPASRQAISRTGNRYVQVVLGLGVRDATSGFRAFRREALERAGVLTLSSNGYCFQVETTYAARRAGLTVREVPIVFTERAEGTSKMTTGIVAEALLRVTGWALGVGRSRLPAARASGRRRVTRSVVAALGLTALAAGLLSAAYGADRQQALAPRPGPGVSTAAAPSAAAASRPAGSAPASAEAPGSPRLARGDQPASLRMPAIGVSTGPLVDLGIAADGTMQVPADYARAGWFTGSAAPGERGPAVIAGHVDSRTGPAVFYRLRDLRAGDVVEVEQRDGDVVRFAVSSVQKYAKDAFPTAKVYGPVPGPALRLITCGGVFDRSTGHYRDNIVVYANPV